MYKLFSYNAEIQYKSSLLSKAAAFTVLSAIIYLVLPFFAAYRSNGFWLQSYYFHEQPLVRFNYDYVLIAETDSPNASIVCGELQGSDIEKILENTENCAKVEINYHDFNEDQKQDLLEFKMQLTTPKDTKIRSVLLIIGIDVQLTTTCPLHMQSTVILNKDFTHQPSLFKYRGDLNLQQNSHLPCKNNVIDSRYNCTTNTDLVWSHTFIEDFIMSINIFREVLISLIPLSSRTQYGDTGILDLNFSFRVPQMHITYLPNYLQQLKWAWPQYLSIMIIFYYITNRIKKLVFSHRLVVAYEHIPWKARVH